MIIDIPDYLPYLVTGTIKEVNYGTMYSDAKHYTKSKIVFANDWEDAKKKFKDFYESKSVDYDTTYYVDDVNVEESIM